MIIRTATEADIPTLVELGRAMHAESPRYSRLSYNPAKVAALAARIVPGGGALVAEREGTIVGMMAGFVVEYWFGDDRMASDFVLYVRPECRKGRIALMLVRAFEAWATAQGAVDIVPGTTTGVEPEMTRRFFEKLGYNLNGFAMFKRVPDV